MSIASCRRDAGHWQQAVKEFSKKSASQGTDFSRVGAMLCDTHQIEQRVLKAEDRRYIIMN